MMRIIAVATILFSPVDANRVKRDVDSGAITSEDGAQFFNSCNDLENMFRTRVANIQAFQEAHPDESDYGVTTHARFTMRTFGAVRILRRARDCPWVVDGNTEDIDVVRQVAHTALAGNPCGDAALVALSAPAPPEDELQPLEQAVQILFSDNCEVPSEGVTQTAAINTDELMTREEEVQDQMDEFMDAAVAEGESIAAGSFIQEGGGLRQARRSVFRMVGAVFLSILYMLSCAAAGAIILALIGMVIAMIPCSILVPGPSSLACLVFPMAGLALGSAAGLIHCGVQLHQGTAPIQ